MHANDGTQLPEDLPAKPMEKGSKFSSLHTFSYRSLWTSQFASLPEKIPIPTSSCQVPYFTPSLISTQTANDTVLDKSNSGIGASFWALAPIFKDPLLRYQNCCLLLPLAPPATLTKTATYHDENSREMHPCGKVPRPLLPTHCPVTAHRCTPCSFPSSILHL